MTEEQIEYAMKMSIQASYDQSETVKDEKMEVYQSCHDPTKIKTKADTKCEDYLEDVNDLHFLQSVLESLPRVDAQSEGVRQAIEDITGTVTKKNTNMMILRTTTNNATTN